MVPALTTRFDTAFDGLDLKWVRVIRSTERKT